MAEEMPHTEQGAEKKRNWSKFLPLLVLVVVAVALVIKRDDLDNFVQTIQQVAIVPFVLACICLFGRYLGHAFAYKELFRCVDEEVPYFHIVPLVFSVTFANDMAPTAGTAGSVLIAAWSHRQGLNMGKSVTIVFLEKIGFFGGFAVVMLVGFAILAATGQMTWYLAAGGVAVFMFVVVFGFVLVLGYKRPETERRLFAWTERMVNRVRGLFKKGPTKPWADGMAGSFHEAANIAAEKPRVLLISLGRMVLLHAFDCMCFVCVGFAFDFTYIPYLVAGYVAGFIIATFIPQTIGAVEVLLALILGGYGATGAQAAAIAIVYRGLIFWVPFLIGAVCINITGGRRSLKSGEAERVMEEGSAENATPLEQGKEFWPVAPARFAGVGGGADGEADSACGGEPDGEVGGGVDVGMDGAATGVAVQQANMQAGVTRQVDMQGVVAACAAQTVDNAAENAGVPDGVAGAAANPATAHETDHATTCEAGDAGAATGQTKGNE